MIHNKTATVIIKMTPAQKQKLKQLAYSHGFNVSEYVRRVTQLFKV